MTDDVIADACPEAGELVAARQSTGPAGEHPLSVLKEYTSWTIWQGVREGDDWRKVPRQFNGRPGDPNNPRNRWPLAEAEAYMRNLVGDAPKGVGIGLGRVVGRWHIIGFDLDAALDDAGRSAPWAPTLIRKLKSYAELSPSSHGAHVLLRLSEEDYRAVRAKLDGKLVWYWPQPEWRSAPTKKRPQIELHLSGYLTFTNRPLNGYLIRIRRITAAELIEVIEDLGMGGKPSALPTGTPEQPRHTIEPIGGRHPEGHVRVEPHLIEWGANHLSDAALQVENARVSQAGRQRPDACHSMVSCYDLWELPGRNRSSTRVQRTVSAANKELERHGRAIRVIEHSHERKGDSENLITVFDLPWLHTKSDDRSFRRKLKIARRPLRAMQKLHAAELRVMWWAIAQAPVEPDAAFPLSPEAMARAMRESPHLCRSVTADRLRQALKCLIKNDWLMPVAAPAGSSPGRYRFGPRVRCEEVATDGTSAGLSHLPSAPSVVEGD